MDYLNGLRKLFGMGKPHDQLRQGSTGQVDQLEQNALNPQLRGAPVQPAPVVPSTGVPAYDAAEQERALRQQALEQALERIRNGGQ